MAPYLAGSEKSKSKQLKETEMKYGDMPRSHEEVILNKLVAAANGDESILKKIVDGVVEITLRLISFLVATSKFVVDYDQSVADSLKEGKYDWVNDGITDANFPSDEKGKREVGFGMFHFNKTMQSEDIIAKMKAEGFRPATMKEKLAYGKKNPEEQRKYPIVALGSVAPLDGGRCVGCLCGGGS